MESVFEGENFGSLSDFTPSLPLPLSLVLARSFWSFCFFSQEKHVSQWECKSIFHKSKLSRLHHTSCTLLSCIQKYWNSQSWSTFFLLSLLAETGNWLCKLFKMKQGRLSHTHTITKLYKTLKHFFKIDLKLWFASPNSWVFHK